MTRKHAHAVLTAAENPRSPGFTITDALDALDRAGAFPSEATEAEIDYVARQVRAADNSDFGEFNWRDYALRLASACRAAGLVK